MSVPFSRCIGGGGGGALYEKLWVCKKPKKSCQAIIRDERNEGLRAIFDVPKEFWSIIGGNSG